MPTSFVKGLAPTFPADGFLYLQIRGIPCKAVKVEVQIRDDSDGLPGTKIWPEDTGTEEAPVVVEWLDVTADTRSAAGVYGLGGWTPDEAIDRGRILWRVQMTEGSGTKMIVHPFEVVDTDVAGSADQVYALVADARSSLPASISDAQIRAANIVWRDLIDRAARQRFRICLEARHFDGNNSDTIFLPEPIFSFWMGATGDQLEPEEILDQYLSIGSGASPLRDLWLNAVQVFGATGEARRNPKIGIIGPVLSTISWGPIWPEGYPNTIFGAWGFVEQETLDCPVLIRQAATRGAILGFGYEPRGGGVRGFLKSETTDGHSYEMALSAGSVRSGLLALLKDPAIRDAITLYRAPIGISTSGCGW